MKGEAEEVELEEGGDLFEEEAPARKQKRKAQAAKKRRTVEEEQEEEEELEPEEVAGLQVGAPKRRAGCVAHACRARCWFSSGAKSCGRSLHRAHCEAWPCRALHGYTFGRRHPTPPSCRGLCPHDAAVHSKACHAAFSDQQAGQTSATPRLTDTGGPPPSCCSRLVRGAS